MKKVIFSLAVAVGLLCCSVVFGQNNDTVLKSTVTKLGKVLDHVTEKAYLHLDRPYPYYVAGENIYFKAYVTMGERHELSDISRILHVDLIGSNNNILRSVALQLTNGIGWGDFSLPDTLQRGSYRIRAYTEWMRNEKAPYFFEQNISVSAVNSAYPQAAVSKSRIPDLQFFPEGGNMVANIKSKIAFKATAPNGLGMNVTGIVTDESGRDVAKIMSAHLGMGYFELTPVAAAKYKAQVTYADGTKSTVDLPTPEVKGITLAADVVDGDKMAIRIRSNRAFFADNLNKEFNLLVYYAGTIKTYQAKLTSPVLSMNIPVKDFPTGIMKITLLSATGEPLNERLIFVQNPDLLNLSVTSDKNNYAKREAVQLKLDARDSYGKAVNGSFSVSVIDESKILVDENSENTILSYLLLKSEVKGYVEKPNYYFAHINNDTRSALDVLMLTQGFRRFVWKELANNTTEQPTANLSERGLKIAGYLKFRNGTGVANNTLILIPDAGMPLSTQTDANGRFSFSDITFAAGTHFILKTGPGSGNGSVLTLDKPLAPPATLNADMNDNKYDTNADILALMQNNRAFGATTASNETYILKNDNFRGVKAKNNYRSSNLSGPGHADQVILGEDIKNAPNMVAALNGVARGVDFFNGVAFRKGYQTVGVGEANSMLLVVDGTIVGLNADINLINPSSVETVEILKEINAAIYGENANAGVIIINSKQGGQREIAESVTMSPGVFSLNPNGYYKAREFFSPQYTAGISESKIPDQRVTVFWKPDVITNADGSATFKYFNADGTGNYRVVVEGIDGKGNLGRQVYRYQVK